jgi:general stress protein 26
MPTQSEHKSAELEAKLWKSLQSDRTMMLGLVGVEEGHTRPMTAQFENDRSPIWFFSSRNSGIVNAIGQSNRAVASFTSKGHDVFASLHGSLSIDNDRATIDRLWNAFVAAWYEDGKEDPDLVLLRFDAERAEIWVDGSNIIAGIKMLLGADPKKEYADNVAEVSLS